jgi:MYXO-CTERM domain-containing protein
MKTKHALAALALAGLSLSASPALAADHNMKISEVGLSKGGDATAQFIELDDPFAEPFPAATYDLAIFNAQGGSLGAVPLVSSTVAANRTNFLVSTASADTKFGVTGNAVLTVTLPANGQACFRRNATDNIHCFAWGTITTLITGASTGPSPLDNESVQRQASGAYAIGTPTPKAANAVIAPPDAGVTDSGTPGTDSGTPASDSGSVVPGTDSGTDSGTKPGTDSGTAGGDGGSLGETPATDDGGCSVVTIGDDTASASLFFSVGALGLVAVARRRKKR